MVKESSKVKITKEINAEFENLETMKKQMKISYSKNTDIFSASHQLYISIVYFLNLNMDKERWGRDRDRERS